MISRQELKQLISRETDVASPMLSVYLDVDQGRAANLNRGFEAALKSLIQMTEKRLTSDMGQKKFLADAGLATSFISEYRPEGKSLVIFCDTSTKFFWTRSLGIRLENKIHWGPRPYVRPILEARDEFERYGVIMTDRAKARLFTVLLGSIEEHHEAFATAEVKRFDGSGTDQMRSQMAFQRRADEHARWHLKHVAELMDKLAVIKKFDRLVLGGTHEVTSELKNLLSERLRKCVIASVSLPIDTSAAQILRETVRIEEEFERDGEEALVTRLLTDAAKGQQAVIGLSPTLEALNEGRIRQLIYTSQFQASGHECLECGYLINHGQDRCPGCGSRCQPVDDLLEAVAVKVFKEGGEVEHLKQHAADRLKKKGEGVGAYLRF